MEYNITQITVKTAIVLIKIFELLSCVGTCVLNVGARSVGVGLYVILGLVSGVGDKVGEWLSV